MNKNLISVSPSELKRNFDLIMKAGTDLCEASDQEVIITIPDTTNEWAYLEAIRMTPANEDSERGVTYGYNYELLKRYHISTDNRINRLESIIKNAFEKKFQEIGFKMGQTIDEAINDAAKEIIKQYNKNF